MKKLNKLKIVKVVSVLAISSAVAIAGVSTGTATETKLTTEQKSLKENVESFLYTKITKQTLTATNQIKLTVTGNSTKTTSFVLNGYTFTCDGEITFRATAIEIILKSVKKDGTTVDLGAGYKLIGVKGTPAVAAKNAKITEYKSELPEVVKTKIKTKIKRKKNLKEQALQFELLDLKDKYQKEDHNTDLPLTNSASNKTFTLDDYTFAIDGDKSLNETAQEITLKSVSKGKGDDKVTVVLGEGYKLTGVKGAPSAGTTKAKITEFKSFVIADTLIKKFNIFTTALLKLDNYGNSITLKKPLINTADEFSIDGYVFKIKHDDKNKVFKITSVTKSSIEVLIEDGNTIKNIKNDENKIIDNKVKSTISKSYKKLIKTFKTDFNKIFKKKIEDKEFKFEKTEIKKYGDIENSYLIGTENKGMKIVFDSDDHNFVTKLIITESANTDIVEYKFNLKENLYVLEKIKDKEEFKIVNQDIRKFITNSVDEINKLEETNKPDFLSEKKFIFKSFTWEVDKNKKIITKISYKGFEFDASNFSGYKVNISKDGKKILSIKKDMTPIIVVSVLLGILILPAIGYLVYKSFANKKTNK